MAQFIETVVVPRRVWLDKRKRTLARAIYGQFGGSEPVVNNSELIEWVDELREMIAPVKTGEGVAGLYVEISEAKKITKSNAILRALANRNVLINDICGATGLSYSNVYNMLKSLFKLGLVRKEEEVFDGNKLRHRYFLTARGAAQIGK